MTDIVLMRLLFVAGLLGLVATVVLVSFAIGALPTWLGSWMPRVRQTRWRTLL
jgi:hypothetical protein